MIDDPSALEVRFAPAFDAENGDALAGLAEWRALGDARSTALALNHISPTAMHLGRYDQARSFLHDSLERCQQVGDRWGLGTAYSHLGLLALIQGDPAEAESHLRMSMEVFAGFISGWDVVQSLVYLGQTLAAAGDAAEAKRIFLNALREAVAVRATPVALDAILGLAELQAQHGEMEWAIEIATCVPAQVASTVETTERAAERGAGWRLG